MGFEVGCLSFRYLGVPLITTKLKKLDCSLLIKKILGWISSWRCKLLSYVGRLTLIKLILVSIQMYWLVIFILPFSLLMEIESFIRVFLWSKVDLNMHKAKVSWEGVCIPFDENGLGSIRLNEWNKTIMVYMTSFLTECYFYLGSLG